MTDQEQTERGASTAEWVTLDDLEPGTLFEAESGTVAVKSEYHYPNCPPEPCQWECIIVGSGEMAHFRDKNQTKVRPIDLIQLRADLERVTAELADVTNERDVWREQVVLVQAERDAMREVVEAGKLVRDVLDDIRTQQREAEVVGRFDAALCSLDATREATADATEEGK